MVAFSSCARSVGHILISIDHFLIWKWQSRCLVLGTATLICDDSFEAFLIISNFIYFLSSLATEIHTLDLLGGLLKGLPVFFGSSTINRRSLLWFLIRCGQRIADIRILHSLDGNAAGVAVVDDGHAEVWGVEHGHMLLVSCSIWDV